MAFRGFHCFGHARGEGLYPSVQPPQFIVSTAIADANLNSATPDMTGLPVTGDIILAHCHLVGGGDGNAPSAPGSQGWTAFVSAENTGGNNSYTRLFWKRWGAGDTDDLTPTFTSAAGSLAVVLSIWRGCIATGSPIEDFSANNGAGGTTFAALDVSCTGLNSAQTFYGCAAATSINVPDVTDNWAPAYEGGSYGSGTGSDRAMASAVNDDAGVGNRGSEVTVTANATMAAWTATTVLLTAV